MGPVFPDVNLLKPEISLWFPFFLSFRDGDGDGAFADCAKFAANVSDAEQTEDVLMGRFRLRAIEGCPLTEQTISDSPC